MSMCVWVYRNATLCFIIFPEEAGIGFLKEGISTLPLKRKYNTSLFFVDLTVRMWDFLSLSFIAFRFISM